jgi:hypothetical protein
VLFKKRIEMKAKFMLLMICLCNPLFSKEVGSVKIAASKTIIKGRGVAKPVRPIKYSRILCNQKSIPMKVEQSLDGLLLTVNFTAQKDLEQFSLKNVRGIDGIEISKFQELLNQKLKSGEMIESSVELSEFTGLVYVVFDVSLTINGVTTEHSIPVGVGGMSTKQVNERKKNIKEVKNRIQQNKFNSGLSVPTKKIHEMKID